jgi:hypothetical protein
MHMKQSFLFLTCICLISGSASLAQQDAVYPELRTLRTALQTLVTEERSGFRNITGSPLYKRTTVQYYSSSVHMVPADTPKIAQDTDPVQTYYMNFVAKGLNLEQSKEAFLKWQELMKAALPDYVMRVAGNQYPDLESFEFVNAGGGAKFTLYRNGSGNACQVSISIIHYGTVELGSTTATETRQVPGKKAQWVEAEGVRINVLVFSVKLAELVAEARTSFKSIKGAKDPANKLLDVYLTNVKLNGSMKQSIIEFPFLGIAYEAVYMEGAKGARGDALFQELREILAIAVPKEFTASGLKTEGGIKTASYTADNGKLIVAVEKSTITEQVVVSVRKKDKY